MSELLKMNAPRDTRKVRKKKSEYMSVAAFVDLKTALEDALAFERGERRNSKVTRIEAPRPPINKTHCGNRND